MKSLVYQLPKSTVYFSFYRRSCKIHQRTFSAACLKKFTLIVSSIEQVREGSWKHWDFWFWEGMFKETLGFFGFLKILIQKCQHKQSQDRATKAKRNDAIQKLKGFQRLRNLPKRRHDTARFGCRFVVTLRNPVRTTQRAVEMRRRRRKFWVSGRSGVIRKRSGSVCCPLWNA